jgi:SAM-dependent methyltransferase
VRDWVIAQSRFEFAPWNTHDRSEHHVASRAGQGAGTARRTTGRTHVSNGYLDLLDARLPTGTPVVEAVFASPVGSMVYDNMQALMRRLFSALQQPTEWLNIPAGGIALDVGCGPGTVTASLARAAGPGGLALGLDLSQAMLARAVRAEARPPDRLPASFRGQQPRAAWHRVLRRPSWLRCRMLRGVRPAAWL